MSDSARAERATVPATLIMTVLNEASGLPAFLQSLSIQTVMTQEIVVIDGGSTDQTLTILNEWVAPKGVRLVVDQIVGAGISQGRNRAIELASFDKILVTDAGTTVDANWMHELYNALGSSDVASGFFEPLAGSFTATLIATAITPSIKEIDPEKFLPSSRSIGFTKNAWRSGEGYPEWLDYCEDLIFDLKMKAAGMRFEFVPSAIVQWEGRSSFRAFAKQYYRYARGDGKASLWAKRHAIRYVAYLGGLALVCLAVFANPLWWVVLAIAIFAYLRKTFARLLYFRRLLGRKLIPALLLSPFVVVLGDVSKMLGYPVGLAWRRKNGAAVSEQNVVDAA